MTTPAQNSLVETRIAGSIDREPQPCLYWRSSSTEHAPLLVMLHQYTIPDTDFADRALHLRRTTGSTRITIFEGATRASPLPAAASSPDTTSTHELTSLRP